MNNNEYLQDERCTGYRVFIEKYVFFVSPGNFDFDIRYWSNSLHCFSW